jgi:excisionase family DNA binding protein
MIEIAAMSKNKKDAATYLGISTRALERHATLGHISVRKEKGATGDVAVYDDEELRRLKAQIDSRRAPRPSVVREVPESSEMVRGSVSGLSQLASGVLFEQIAKAFQPGNIGKRTTISIGEKILLTLADASALSSLSQGHLSAAIHGAQLKAKKIGRGWKIKRSDLDAYVKKL